MPDGLCELLALNILDGSLRVKTRGQSMFGAYMTEILIVLGVIVVLALLLLVWAAYLRKPKRRRSHSHLDPVVVDARRSAHEEDDDDEEDEGGGKPGRRKRRVKVRYRRRDHRPRNPTLAETGGLPPPRESGEAS